MGLVLLCSVKLELILNVPKMLLEKKAG